MAALREGGVDDVEVTTIELRGADGDAVPAIHARPEGMPRRGLVLHPDIMGLRPLFEDLCRRLATHGIAVCAPEPFARFDVAGADPAARMQRLADCERYLLKSMPVIPIFHNVWLYLQKPFVRGLEGNALDKHPFKYSWIDTNWRPS